MWIRGIAGIAFCALGAVWIAQGSGAMHGSGMSGHASFALLGGVAVIVGLTLLVWAARIRRGALLPEQFRGNIRMDSTRRRPRG